jgi:hypothetical protein
MAEAPLEAPGVPGGFSHARLAELGVRPQEWAWWSAEEPRTEIDATGGQLPVGEGLVAILVAAVGLVALLAGVSVVAWVAGLWCGSAPARTRGRAAVDFERGATWRTDGRDARCPASPAHPGRIFHDVHSGAMDVRARQWGYVFLLTLP